MMFCGKCGKEIPDGATFCGACGAAQVQSQAPNSNIEKTDKPKDPGLKGLIVALMPFGVIAITIISFLAFGFKDCGYVSYNYQSYSVGSCFSPDRYEPTAWGRAWNASGAEADAKELNKLCREQRFEKGGIGMLVSVGVGLGGVLWLFIAIKLDDK